VTLPYLLEPAALEWEGGAPYSSTYDDIYWHRDGALAEKQFVFVDALKRRIGMPQPGSQVTVGELGFGFGINCLLTADFWRDMPADCMLNIVSIEKHPVGPDALERHLGQYDFAFSDKLLEQYPPAYAGQHVIWLASNIRLLLIFDEVETALANLDAEVDVWYLDGFAPAKNSEMWSDAVFKKMFARSRPGTQVATYSAAGAVKRGLEQNGFTVNKLKGFAHKKEMIAATRPGHWSWKPHSCPTPVIIGAGIAGVFCLEALARRGMTARLIDSGNPGASSIPQLTVFPQLAVRPEAKYRFSLAASRYMQNAPGYYASGLAWQGRTAEEATRIRKIAGLFPDYLIRTQSDGSVFFEQAGWLSHKELLASLQPEITTGHVEGISWLDNQWTCSLNNGTTVDSRNLIIATGYNRELLPKPLQVRAISGQAVSVKTDGIAHIINSQVTVFPTYQGRSVVSGTYDRGERHEMDIGESEGLIARAGRLAEITPGDEINYQGVRAVSRDRLPIIGTMPDWHALGDVNRLSDVTDYQRGLYLCTAFGSRGATHARLCAEHLVSKLLGEPAALDSKHQLMLAAARFAIRDANSANQKS
jgi:tRNA 5-methylaminomethyl-2-thiouridine biosynthesis bifunctional protein